MSIFYDVNFSKTSFLKNVNFFSMLFLFEMFFLESQLKMAVISDQVWTGNFSYQVISAVLITAMALVLFAAISYQCAATWKWIKDKTCREYSDSDSNISKQAAIRISHSLPDLQTEPLKKEYVQEHKDVVKKVRPQVSALFTF